MKFRICNIVSDIWTKASNDMDKSYGKFYNTLIYNIIYLNYYEYNLSTTNKRKRFGTNLNMKEMSL